MPGRETETCGWIDCKVILPQRRVWCACLINKTALISEEFQVLIKLIESNKEKDADWFRIEANDDGTRWFGK